ncbi:hypothetical protein [Priestia megaterium]|uniref:hypothetical protein n=1 Tax=Priestia megaterium TaxID=1404 RepID=UPI002A6A5F08|nr:hypothetical protein [Priestia megaterium]MDY0944152.1 hypothetical protein [Priestia megaterium]
MEHLMLIEEKETVNVDDVMSDSETESTEEIDDHALITTLYSDQRKTNKEQTRICAFGQ